LREDLKAELAALDSVFTKLGGESATMGAPDLGANNPPWGKT
jgi:hypothetical protein